MATPAELDKPQCNCGVVGVFNHPQASLMTYYALHSLQHRGQEAAGIVASRYDDENEKWRYRAHKSEGLVLEIFDGDVLTKHLAGTRAIGHNRYSTTGGAKKSTNIQPFLIRYHMGSIGLAHNGNLTNTRALREELHKRGAIFATTTDSELFLHLIALSTESSQEMQIRDAMRIARGAYSLVITTDEAIYAARDPHGIRPLALGRKQNADGTWAWMAASETCAFDICGFEYVRDVKHNEIVKISGTTGTEADLSTTTIDDETPEAKHCIFEYIYFSRPDSQIFGHSVDKVRRRLGKNLMDEHPVNPDEGDVEKVVTIPVPDSANTAALGYTQQAAKEDVPMKYELGLIRSHYVGRTFIAPGQDSREFKVKTKFNTVRGVIEGRKIVLVDDSIVRGTTSKSLISLVKQSNPTEVHMRISSPPITHPCKYGMDFPSSEELIANHCECDPEKIADKIGANSVAYMSVDNLMDSVPQEEGIGYCTACFTGQYPIPIDLSVAKLVVEDEED